MQVSRDFRHEKEILAIFSISAVLSLPTELEIVMFALRPDVFSVAVTFRIPLTSTSKTTSKTASPAFIAER